MRPNSPYLDEVTNELIDVEIQLGMSTPPFPKSLAKGEILKYSSMAPAAINETLVVKKFLAKKTHVTPEQIQFYPGSSQAFFQILAGITDPGDSVAIESPVYDPFTGAAQFLDLRILRFERHRDPAKDMAWHRANSRQVQILCISNPHCPTGWMYSAEQIDELSRLYSYILVDEVFLPRFDKGKLSRVSKVSRPNVITIGGMSKSTGLGQLRFGWSAAPEEFVQRIKSVGNLLHIEMPAPSVVGAAKAFKSWNKIMSLIEKQASLTRPLARKFAKKMGEKISHDFKTGHFAVLEIPPTYKDSREFVADLVEAGIHLRPCDQFEMPRHVRFHIFIKPELLRRVFSEIEKRY